MFFYLRFLLVLAVFGCLGIIGCVSLNLYRVLDWLGENLNPLSMFGLAGIVILSDIGEGGYFSGS